MSAASEVTSLAGNLARWCAGVSAGAVLRLHLPQPPVQYRGRQAFDALTFTTCKLPFPCDLVVGAFAPAPFLTSPENTNMRSSLHTAMPCCFSKH